MKLNATKNQKYIKWNQYKLSSVVIARLHFAPTARQIVTSSLDVPKKKPKQAGRRLIVVSPEGLGELIRTPPHLRLISAN